MDIQSLVLWNALTTQGYRNQTVGPENYISFSDVLTQIREKGELSTENIFSLTLPTSDVSLKMGSYTASDIQQELTKAGYNKMVVVIPKELQEKMDADPDYAQDVAEKVRKWKWSYDGKNSAFALSYGYNTSLYQMNKSYGVWLDAEGNVKDYTVARGGKGGVVSFDTSVKQETAAKQQRHLSSSARLTGTGLQRHPGGGSRLTGTSLQRHLSSGSRLTDTGRQSHQSNMSQGNMTPLSMYNMYNMYNMLSMPNSLSYYNMGSYLASFFGGGSSL